VDKGTRIKIISGEGMDQTGTVFWTGKDRYRDGLRLGVRGDDGETYWISQADVEETDAVVPVGETFDKGDRVRFRNSGAEGFGTVFWIGQSRDGPGQRLGIRDDSNPEDAIWLDARFAEALAEGEGPPAPPPPARGSRGGGGGGGGGGGRRDEEVDEMPADYAPSLSSDEMPPMAPIDDSYADQMAQQIDDEGDVPF
jgi:hypothetical protein